MFTNVKFVSTIQKNVRHFSVSGIQNAEHSCRLLVVGGGAGGCAVAAKFNNSVKDIIILEPNDKHYYQPMFTLIGGGIKQLKDSYKPMGDVLPKKAKWLKSGAAEFHPEQNMVVTENGDKIKYDYLLVGMGLQLNYNQIPGLEEALNMPIKESMVCSNYSPKYVDRTFQGLEEFKSGNLIFTFPNTSVKCPGAPQKALYIAEHYLRKNGKRENANVMYNSSLAVIFGVKKYADALWKIVEKRNINVNLRTNLIEVLPEQKKAVFQNLDKPEEKHVQDYAFLHVTPPMSAPSVLMKNKDITNELGYLSVNKDTLQHTKYPNVFGIGDCTSSPNSKTAASVAAQSQVVYRNMKAVMEGKQPEKVYNGYASCPLVTGYNSCILAEFDYNLQPMETFPISQDREMYLMYLMKKDIMPPLYWKLMLNGYWNGPGVYRKLMNPFAA